MKALSLWQPHVLAIALGLKPWETRDWPTSYRGPLALHAARHKWTDAEPWDIEAVRRLRRKLYPAMAEAISDQASYSLVNAQLCYGAVICIADVADCVRTSRLRGRIPDEHEFWGDFSDGERGRGRFAFKLENVRMLDPPLSWRGQLGFFDVELPGAAAPRPPAMASLFGPEGGW
jgi:hypothetical protein